MIVEEIVPVVLLGMALVISIAGLIMHSRKKVCEGFLMILLALPIVVIAIQLSSDYKLKASPAFSGSPPLSLAVSYSGMRCLLMGGVQGSGTEQARVIVQAVADAHASRLAEDQEIIFEELQRKLAPLSIRLRHIEIVSEYSRRYPPDD